MIEIFHELSGLKQHGLFYNGKRGNCQKPRFFNVLSDHSNNSHGKRHKAQVKKKSVAIVF
jgi:hypothetical protein